jgi:hypothetical protein
LRAIRLKDIAGRRHTESDSDSPRPSPVKTGGNTREALTKESESDSDSPRPSPVKTGEILVRLSPRSQSRIRTQLRRVYRVRVEP